MKYLSKILQYACNIQHAVSITALIAMVVLNSIEIIRRFFFGLSWVWIQEYTILLLVIFTFCGFSKVVYDKNDVTIDLITGHIPNTIRKVIQICVYLSIICFCCIYTYYTYELLLSQAGQTTPVAHYPMQWRTIPALINGVSMTFIYLGELKDCLFGTKGA